ncbi:hypothetical protein QUF70_04355 [Desulfobacterales bacterium HSG17]|nr:hypothetical protein [Desulfobacterales bacterium HSG17]
MSRDKRPATTYLDYRYAAEVHIAACKELRKRLKESHGLYRDEKDRKKVKQELYYLSGYIIECMITYALGSLLDRLNPDDNIHEENILEIDKLLKVPGQQDKRKISFNFFKEGSHSIERKLNHIKQYEIRDSIPIIHKEYHKNSDLSDKFKQLHESWLPHHRYKLADDVKGILENDKLLYDFIEFTIQFTNMTYSAFQYRTQD